MGLPVTLTEQYENMRSKEISYKNLHKTAVLYNEGSDTSIKIPWESISAKYSDALSKIRIQINLSDAMVLKYRYSPKLVSYDLYGTTEFWNDILLLNNCGSTLDFTNLKRLIVYDPSELKSLINEAMILEDKI